MKNWLRVFLFVPVLIGCLVACETLSPRQQNGERVEASLSEGFEFPYYLYLPPVLKHGEILVVPNNSGFINDSLSVHEDKVKADLGRYARLADALGCALLIPVFPRMASDWKTYTHALDRETLLNRPGFSVRLDLQLKNMVEHARSRLEERGIESERRVLLFGFSAAGMFANRFSLIHPDFVAGVAAGSPGGWPLAPVDSFEGQSLPYPIGIGDLPEMINQGVDLASFAVLPQFIFMGDEDKNDSVPYSDGYDREQKAVVFALFGATPMERWEKSRALYQTVSTNAEFKLYPKTGHRLTEAMVADTVAFFQTILEGRHASAKVMR